MHSLFLSLVEFHGTFVTISTIAKKLHWVSATTVLPVVFLVIVIIGSAVAGTGQGAARELNIFNATPILGGPEAVSVVYPEVRDVSFLASADPIGASARNDVIEGEEITFASTAALRNTAGPANGTTPTRDGLTIYRVGRGETLSRVAVNFGISLNTILWANPGLKGKVLQPGDEIIVLPVSGVLHEVKEGETVETIAELYGVPPSEFFAVNPKLSENPLTSGERVIVPGGRPRTSSVSQANLPNLAGYFAIPAAGWNWGELHSVNAVDVSNACGTPVYAAAEGLVVGTGSPTQWNDGYGGFVEIEHPNGTGTRYAHLSEGSVSAGDWAEKKQKIGEIGNTGNVTGVTGCHLHFEVQGARNPLVR